MVGSGLERKSRNPGHLKIIRPLWGFGFSTKIQLSSNAKAPLCKRGFGALLCSHGDTNASPER